MSIALLEENSIHLLCSPVLWWGGEHAFSRLAFHVSLVEKVSFVLYSLAISVGVVELLKCENLMLLHLDLTLSN
eukprot:m.78406 g.78406  ORF g.78406 m.78406 type:complete len:74 (+) comp14106_c1_seq1:541-762(+)